MSEILLQNVNCKYRNGPHVLQGFSMRIQRGATIAVLGPTGSGKSTVMRIIAGIDHHHSGPIRRDLKTSWIIPNYSFFSHYGTGAANARFVARFYGMDEEDYLRAVMDMSELGSNMNGKLDKLPGPMKGQLGISMALCLDTDVYLFDEYVGVNPPAFRQKCTDAIQELIRRGKSVVIATSSATIATPFCKEAYVIDAGVAVYHANLAQGVEHLTSLTKKA